jgi:hypothetical protein
LPLRFYPFLLRGVLRRCLFGSSLFCVFQNLLCRVLKPILVAGAVVGAGEFVKRGKKAFCGPSYPGEGAPCRIGGKKVKSA